MQCGITTETRTSTLLGDVTKTSDVQNLRATRSCLYDVIVVLRHHQNLKCYIHPTNDRTVKKREKY